MSSALLPRLLPQSARSSSSALPSSSRRSIPRRRIATTTSTHVQQRPTFSSPSHSSASSSSQPPPEPQPETTYERAAPPHTTPEAVVADTEAPRKPRLVPLDMQDFLRGYPLFVKNRWQSLNASFYANEQLATPSDWTIEDLLFRLRKDPSQFKDDK